MLQEYLDPLGFELADKDCGCLVSQRVPIVGPGKYVKQRPLGLLLKIVLHTSGPLGSRYSTYIIRKARIEEPLQWLGISSIATWTVWMYVSRVQSREWIFRGLVPLPFLLTGFRTASGPVETGTKMPNPRMSTCTVASLNLGPWTPKVCNILAS